MTSMNAAGGVTSGICSTFSRAYENTPSTHSATITMVANTGLLMATRVIHIQSSRSASRRAGSAHRRPVARGRDVGLGRLVGHHHRRCPLAQVVEAHAEHLRVVGEA